MADTYTKIADLIDPEVMGDMVSARIPKKLRVAPFAKVDDTLAGVPGDTITVPAYVPSHKDKLLPDKDIRKSVRYLLFQSTY